MRWMITAACVLVLACGGGDDSPEGGANTGGAAGQGGAPGKGGSAGQGAAPATGGAPSEGGAAGQGGAAGESGTPSEGGAPGGGEAGSGGVPEPQATLSIEPSGTDGKLQITGPTEFTATLVNGSGTISWSVTGGGALSATEGPSVRFTPPLGTATETLTATADGASVSVEITSSPPVLTGVKVPGLKAPVTVQYDAEDIPHIQCANTADCLAVQGYVHARDRLFPMDFLRHTARSRLSELIGPAGLAQDVQLRTLLTTRSGHRLEDDLSVAMDAATKVLVSAYVRGINAYLTELRAAPSQLPGEYAELPYPITPADIADWTLEDTVALIRLQQFQLSEDVTEESAFATFAAVYGPGGALEDLGKLNAWVRAAPPTTESAHTLSPAAARSVVSPRPAALSKWARVLEPVRARLQTLSQSLRPLASEVGSNNWVVAASKSASHAALVANDPHIGLRYPPLFHLSVLTSSKASDNLNLAGGIFPGLPGALVGRGAHVGWGVSTAGYDVTDLYLEQFLPQGNCPSAAPCVLFNGAPTAVLVVPQTFMVRVGAGSAGLVDAQTLSLPTPPPPVVVVVPQHGPLVQAPDDDGHAVSARWSGHEGNTNDLKAVLGLGTAADVDAAVSALADFSTGAQNFVLADDEGHIAYDAHALIPVRRFADVRLKGADVLPPWFPLPGDGSAEWGDGVSNCAAATATPVPASCWLDADSLPHGKDPANGYFFTANNDPTGASDDNNPLAHPPYLSFNWDDSTNFRAKRIQDLLEQAISKRGVVSVADSEAIQSDHVSRPGMALTEYVAALPTHTNDSESLVAAKAVLASWASTGWDCPSGLLDSDPETSAVDTAAGVRESSSGCFFFHAFLRTLITNVFSDDFAVIGQGVDNINAMRTILLLLLDAETTDGAAGATFCNDVDANGAVVAEHTCAEQADAALVAAYDGMVDELGDSSHWLWGRAHTITPISFSPFATASYSPGPFARPGGAFTLDVGTPLLSGSGLDFAYRSGANVRHISVMDPAAPVVKMQLPGPERDAPATTEAPNLLGEWLQNTYFDMAFGDQIDAAAVSTQAVTAP
jgi:penicillin amidase